MTAAEPIPAYEGLLVVDLSRRMAGAFAARLFADHGASVTMLESPEGHPLRHEAPFLRDEPGTERSALHGFVNWSKCSVTIDEPHEAEAWIANADLVITTDGPSALQHWPLESLRSDAVHLSLTPHGLDGPLADAPASNLSLCARAGWAHVNAMRDEQPLALPSRQSGYIGGYAGFLAAAAALRRRDEAAQPEVVDVRELEALIHTVYPWTIAAVYQGIGWSRGAAGGRPRGEPGPLWDAADGRMNFGFGDWHNWRDAMELFNLPDQGAREDLQEHGARYSKDLEPVRAGVARELPNLDKWPLFHALAKLRCISGVLQTIPELVENEQLQSREFIVETELDSEPVQAAGNPHPMSPPSWAVRTPAPTLGSHKASAPERISRTATHPTQTRRGPLDGVRVLTFTQAWSGTFGTELLALLGADVVQIEALQRVDIWRKVGPAVPNAIRDESKTQHPVNTQGLYNAVNLSKRGIALDLNSEEGRQLFWQMVPDFDVVCENFRPGVLANWGITLEALAERRTDIILASISGYGLTGPYSSYPANGATTEPMSGLASLHGYLGDTGMNTAGLYPDPVSGYAMAGAVVAALARRDRVAGPQQIDVAMIEAMAVAVGDAIVEWAATGRVPTPLGNSDRQRAPHGVYRCRGDDEWLAIAVETEAQWLALCQAIGKPDLASDARFRDAAGRKAGEMELDAALSAWTQAQDAAEAEGLLLAVGVDAARVARPYEQYSQPDDYLRTTEFIQSVDHPEVGPSWLPGAPWRFNGPEDRILRPSPCVGQHSQAVLREELGISPSDYESLVERKITGTMDDWVRLNRSR